MTEDEEFEALVPSRSYGGGGGRLSFLMILPALLLPGFAVTGIFKSGSQAEAVSEEVSTEVAASAVDLSSVWPIIGLVAAGIGILALSAGTFWLLKRGRHSSLALRKEREAAEEDRRQALAVWQKFVDRHHALKTKALEIETDWDMLFSYPTLVDASVPQMLAFHRALSKLDSASNIAPAGINLSMEISELPYPKLVAEAEVAWNVAWSFAKRTGLKLIPRAERKKLDQIAKLLKLARSSGGSDHERSLAYGQIRKLIDGLEFVKVPEPALKSIGTESRRMIESHSEGFVLFNT